MKKSYLISSILALCVSLMLNAIPPYPGLKLTEPVRPRIPDSENVSVRRVNSSHNAPKINLAPRVLLILVDFTDKAFQEMNTQLAFDSLANADEYRYNGATGSCKQYFIDQSNGQYIPEFDVIGPVHLPQNMAYYGDDKSLYDDRCLFEFVHQACLGADQLGVNFADYDNDNDGFVDFVYILYAGFGQADGGEKATIWPHAWDLKSVLYYGYHDQSEYYANSYTDFHLPQIDGKTLDTYACSSELKFSNKARSGIGTICHEFSHVLGLPDYYHTTENPATNKRNTPGAWSLMGYGNYLNNGNTPPNYSVYDKYFLGWLEPTVLTHSQSLEIPADGQSSYMLARDDNFTGGPYTNDTVYYIENRQQVGWDAYLPGHGMLVWRVIYDELDWYSNWPNDFVVRYQLISAEKRSSPYTEGDQKQEVPFPGKSNVTEYKPFDHKYIENIQEIDGIITCDFINTSSPTALDNLQVPSDGCWYNIMGQPVDPSTYKGIVIHNKQKYLLR